MGAVRARRDLKSWVWARARAEARVPIRRVRGGVEVVGVEVGGAVEVEVEGSVGGPVEEESVEGICAGREGGGAIGSLGGGAGADDEELEVLAIFEKSELIQQLVKLGGVWVFVSGKDKSS